MNAWSKRWKQAAKDWRRTAYRRGQRVRSRTDEDRVIDVQFALRGLYFRSLRYMNAVKRNDAVAIAREGSYLERTLANVWRDDGPLAGLKEWQTGE